MLQQTMIQMKHQQILQQQILEVLGAENQCSLFVINAISRNSSR